MKTDTIVLLGLGIYFLLHKSTPVSATSLSCPGEPGCPGYPLSLGTSTDNSLMSGISYVGTPDGNCPAGYGLYTTYDPTLDVFSSSCQPNPTGA